MNFNFLFTTFFILLLNLSVFAQENYKFISPEDSVKIYKGGNSYDVEIFPQKFKSKKPKNIILMIGDGMGASHVFAGITANHGHLFIENFKQIGFSKTQSADSYVTDSSAGGTALSSGVKTYNGAIGVDPDTVPVKTILEIAEEMGKATGLVSTSAITHATPASFIAHQPSRRMSEEIAADFLKTGIDVFIGGGYTNFADRKDGHDLTAELREKGYRVLQNLDEIEKVRSGKLAGLTARGHNGHLKERKDMLPRSTQKALHLLSQDKDGFFLMVEGSFIDHGGHQNNTIFIVEEMLDFDKAIGEVLKFAARDGETLIIVTADHETGGFAVLDGDIQTGMVIGGFSTGSHTAVMVPLFAYGPGAEQFSGIMENTDVAKKIIKFL